MDYIQGIGWDILASVLFWNTKKNARINGYLLSLIIGYHCDIIVLCEYSNNPAELLLALEQCGLQYQEITFNKKGRVRVITKNHINSENILDDSYYTIIDIEINGQKILLTAVHLPSKMHVTEIGQINEARLLREQIEKAEITTNNRNTVIVGDFNINPFEHAMIGACGIHAIPFKSIAAKQYRKIRGKNYGMFYNPMWKFLSYYETITGTYYYDNSDMINYFWNVFDQVVIRPNLVDYFNLSALKVITTTSEGTLLHNGKPNDKISDHLPIYFELSKEEIV